MIIYKQEHKKEALQALKDTRRGPLTVEEFIQTLNKKKKGIHLIPLIQSLIKSSKHIEAKKLIESILNDIYIESQKSDEPVNRSRRTGESHYRYEYKSKKSSRAYYIDAIEKIFQLRGDLGDVTTDIDIYENFIKHQKNNELYALLLDKSEPAIMKSIQRALADLYKNSSYSPDYINLGKDTKIFKLKNNDALALTKVRGKPTSHAYELKSVAKGHSNKREFFSKSETDKMGLVEDLVKSLNTKLLERYLPSDYFYTFNKENALNDDNHPNSIKRQRFVKSIALLQRGQPRWTNSATKNSNKDTLDILYKAIIDNKLIKFSYLKDSSSSSFTEYLKVKVIGVVFRYPRIYLVGYDVTRKDYLTFVLDRIASLLALDETPPDNTKSLTGYLKADPFNWVPATFKNDSGIPIPNTVVFDILATNQQAYLVNDIELHHLSPQYPPKISKRNNGDIRVTLEKHKISYALIEWLISRHSSITVEKPLKLRNHIKTTLEDTLKNYL